VVSQIASLLPFVIPILFLRHFRQLRHTLVSLPFIISVPILVILTKQLNQRFIIVQLVQQVVNRFGLLLGHFSALLFELVIAWHNLESASEYTAKHVAERLDTLFR